MVVDDKSELKGILANLNPEDQAKLRIREANDKLVFVPIDHLNEVL